MICRHGRRGTHHHGDHAAAGGRGGGGIQVRLQAAVIMPIVERMCSAIASLATLWQARRWWPTSEQSPANRIACALSDVPRFGSGAEPRQLPGAVFALRLSPAVVDFAAQFTTARVLPTSPAAPQGRPAPAAAARQQPASGGLWSGRGAQGSVPVQPARGLLWAPGTLSHLCTFSIGLAHPLVYLYNLPEVSSGHQVRVPEDPAVCLAGHARLRL